MFFSRTFAVSAAAFVCAMPSVVFACDLCAVYAADQASGQESRGFYAGLSEQFTRYDRLTEGSQRLRDDSRQYLDSSITQFLFGYGFSPRFSVQLGVPYIDRSFSRPGPIVNDSGTVSGLGDLNLVAQYSPWRYDSEDWTFTTRLLAGLKLPTGDSDRIAEELTEGDEESATPSGIHGHDLALGSGSLDYVFGGDVGARYGRWLARANLQYALRTRGDFDYRYGNDVQWTIGAGHYLLLTEGQTVALNVNFSGEYKYFDTFQGGHPEDTQSRILFLGPQISSSFQDRYSVDFRADFPVQEYGSAIQTLPAYRLRLSFLMRF